MSVVVVTPPAAVVSLDEAKLQLWIDADDTSKDAMIQPMIDAATALIDGPAGWLGRAIGQQTLEWRGRAFPSGGWLDPLVWRHGWPDETIHLLDPPVQSVSSVSYLDQTGTRQTLAPAAYELDEARLSPVWGTTWPVLVREAPDSVRVQYLAGYAADAVPAPIKQAILIMVASLNDNRDSASGSVTGTVAALLAPYRVFA